MITFTVLQIAQLLGAEIEGNPDEKIFDISKIEEGSKGSITFLANPKYESYLYNTQASAVIVSNDFVPKSPVSATLIKVENPYQAFTMLLQKASEALQYKSGVETPSFVSPTAKIGKDVYIGAFAYIGNYATIEDGAKIYPNTYVGDGAKVGKNTTLFANVTLYAQCQIGNDCVVHSGTVIGADGFGHAPQADGTYAKVPQLGNVVIGNDVEIGANAAIDRATLGSTIIKDGVKLDNFVQVAHNVVIGKHTVIAALTGIAGSTKIGDYCMIGGQVGIVGHIQIANRVKLGAKAGVSKNITQENTAWRGAPVQEYRRQLKSEAVFKHLESLVQRVESLEKQLNEKK